MEQSIIWAQGHINNCQTQHKLCSARHGDESITPTPTRLIDVSPGWEGRNVKLRDRNTLPTSCEYAALSYCWGDHMPDCMTTPRTIDQNLRCILWDTLPKTFCDAIEFTKGLGLKYLWIDSICIIQGDQGDWQKESGKMFDVYKNSKVTLAALAGKDSTSGLRTSTIKQETRLAATLRLGKFTCPLYIRHKHYMPGPGPQSVGLRDPIRYERFKFPLLTRAWTFQERIISPRVVFFSESEVIYECACEFDCECDASMSRQYDSVDFSKRPKRRIFQATHSVSEGDIDMCSSKIAEIWRNAVAKVYSRLEITKPSDRLVALGAISEQFQQARPGSEYLAGLWTDSLVDDLLWCLRTSSGLSWPDLSFPSAISLRHFNLPTWSWASRKEEISYWLKPEEHLVEVVEARCLYAEDNQFGDLKSSTLILRGMMLSCTLGGDHLRLPLSCGDSWVELDCRPDLDFDFKTYFKEPLTVYLLRIGRNAGGFPYSLILRLEDRNACPKVFSRLGIVGYSSYEEPSAFEKIDPSHAFEQRGTIEEIEIR
ncbi:heterokaryon incompatibility protein-domain-containing protein [Phyllosticta capitalensis]